MKISIEYESSWRNSFLDGDNNEHLPKNGRKFIGSMTNLKKPENVIKREVTYNTVMGLLNRLIGDQRKLYQSRNSDDYYFKNIEPLVNFHDDIKVENSEMVYIRNITGSTDQNSFAGAVKADSPMLTSDFSSELWGILGLSFEELCYFILEKKYFVNSDVSLNPLDLVELSNHLDKDLKVVDLNSDLEKVINYLNEEFHELVTIKQPTPYIEKNGKVKPVRFYAAALYIQLNRLASKYDIKLATTKAGKIAGFSKRGFNGKRDFIKNFVTGGEKKVWGGAYAKKNFKSLVPLLTKTSGKLEITIDVEKTKANELKGMIENAGVSSFYLGKKGLAYVTKIRV